MSAREDRISHGVAMAAAQRLIANAFGGHKAKLSIPAEEDDDDLLLVRYIQQQAGPDERTCLDCLGDGVHQGVKSGDLELYGPDTGHRRDCVHCNGTGRERHVWIPALAAIANAAPTRREEGT